MLYRCSVWRKAVILPFMEDNVYLYRNLCGAMLGVALLMTGGCKNDVNARVEAVKQVVSLSLTPEQFKTRYNEKVVDIVPVMFKDDDTVMDASLINMYKIYAMKATQGREQGMFEAQVGPAKINLLGKVNDNGVLVSIGGNLGDNAVRTRKEFLLAMVTMGAVLTQAEPEQLSKTIGGLMQTILNNPDGVVASSVGEILFTVSLSSTGMTIQATHVQ